MHGWRHHHTCRVWGWRHMVVVDDERVLPLEWLSQELGPYSLLSPHSAVRQASHPNFHLLGFRASPKFPPSSFEAPQVTGTRGESSPKGQDPGGIEPPQARTAPEQKPGPRPKSSKSRASQVQKASVKAQKSRWRPKRLRWRLRRPQKVKMKGLGVYPWWPRQRDSDPGFRVFSFDRKIKCTLAAWPSVVWVAWQPPSERAQWGAGAHGAHNRPLSRGPPLCPPLEPVFVPVGSLQGAGHPDMGGKRPKQARVGI